MCQHDIKILIALYESLKKVRPEFAALERDIAFYNGTLHGIKLSVQQLPPSDIKKAA